MPNQTTAKALYLMVGGFLGAGKTTAILKLAGLLKQRGRSVGLISNDQSYGLVDTKMYSAAGFPVEEITGGCFCCKFNSLVEASTKLTARTLPDAFIAEPVGSCTDLKATVDYPLRRMYGDQYALAPFSVLVDPVRALRVLGLETGKSFSSKVLYIYDKQLEEAEIIVINKVDLLSPERLTTLRKALESKYPQAKVMEISARNDVGLEAWLDEILARQVHTAGAMDVDYDVYADGEALLGWLNSAVAVTTDIEFDGNAWLKDVARRLHAKLTTAEIEVAHMKLMLNPDEGNDIAVLNLVSSDFRPELSHALHEPLASGEMIINLRAEADPERLSTLVREVIADLGQTGDMKLTLRHLEAFRPGRPMPTHRLVQV